MSYTLKTDEILEALQISSHPLADSFMRRLEGLTDEMASALAMSQGVEKGLASFEGVDFGGPLVFSGPHMKVNRFPNVCATMIAPRDGNLLGTKNNVTSHPQRAYHEKGIL